MPFLTWMVDAFTIDKQKDYTENNKTTAMSLEQWAKQNQFMIELTEKHPKKAEELKAAMKAYSKRMIPRLQYSPPTKIDDEMSEIVDYITSMPKFIESVLLLGRKQDSAGVSPPFCVCSSLKMLHLNI